MRMALLVFHMQNKQKLTFCRLPQCQKEQPKFSYARHQQHKQLTRMFCSRSSNSICRNLIDFMLWFDVYQINLNSTEPANFKYK